MFFGILGLNGRLDYINAGHPLPILLRRGEVTEPLMEGSFPVGLLPETVYVTSHAQLQPDDTLVLYSDGLTEAMDPDEQMFGVSRLCGVLSGQQDAPLDYLQKAILESVQRFTRGARQGDDITLLLIRYQAVAQSVTS